MMMMLMFLHHFGELFCTDIFICRSYLCFGPFKYFLCLNAVIRILHILFVFHHFLNIIRYPGLIIAQVGATHIAEELLFGKASYFVRRYLNGIILNNFISDQSPFQLAQECREFLSQLKWTLI